MIIYDKVLTPQAYLEIMTGNYYILKKPNQVEEVEKILDKEEGNGAYWTYSLYDTPEVIENNKNVVLVEFVNITDASVQEHIYRWCEIPEELTREDFLKKLKEL